MKSPNDKLRFLAVVKGKGRNSLGYALDYYPDENISDVTGVIGNFTTREEADTAVHREMQRRCDVYNRRNRHQS
jgi:hypothetical protein